MSKKTDNFESMNVDELLRRVNGFANMMCSILTKTNKKLTKGDIDGIEVIAEQQKETLGKINQIEEIILRDPSLLDTANQKIVKDTKAVYSKMNKLIIENKTYLELGVQTAKTLIDAITHDVIDQRKQELGYNKNGKMATNVDLERNMPYVSVMSKG